MAQHITVVDYDPSWPTRFAAERALLAPIFGDEALAIWHIGSTAVPGLAAKPIIDIMVGGAGYGRSRCLGAAVCGCGL